MSDPADQAQVWEERHRRDALAAQQQQAASDGPGNGDCEMCGEGIPPARLRAVPNARCCVYCQSIADQRRRTLYGGH